MLFAPKSPNRPRLADMALLACKFRKRVPTSRMMAIAIMPIIASVVVYGGGLVETETMRLLDEWKRRVQAGKWAAALKRVLVLVGLVRVRARRFEIG